MRPLSHLIVFALILCGAAATPSQLSASETVIVYRDAQPASRAWVSGHYAWIGDTWAYVPGHWVVATSTCRTTEVQRCGETIVYADPPPCLDRVVVVQPSCRPVHRDVCVAPDVVPPPFCAPRHGVDVHISAPLPLPLLLPVPLPLPFPFFHHHH